MLKLLLEDLSVYLRVKSWPTRGPAGASSPSRHLHDRKEIQHLCVDHCLWVWYLTWIVASPLKVVRLITTGNLAGVNLTFNVSSRVGSQSWGTSSWRSCRETPRHQTCWWGRWTSWTLPSWHLFACRRLWCWEPWPKSQFPQGDRKSPNKKSVCPCLCAE